MNDPYPPDLDQIDNAALGFAPASDPLIAALNRIATAIEKNTAALLPQSPPAPASFQRPANLAALPPVQVVDQKPACPFHGIDKVLVSTNGKGGFFCSAKGGSGPVNAKGYCTWHS